MPRESAKKPADMPCVVCARTPSAGFDHEPGPARGRVCADHARAAAEAGHVVASDKGGIVNWPTYERA